MRSLSDQLKFVKGLRGTYLRQSSQGDRGEYLTRQDLLDSVIATLEKLKWLEEVSEEMKAREQAKAATRDDS